MENPPLRAGQEGEAVKHRVPTALPKEEKRAGSAGRLGERGSHLLQGRCTQEPEWVGKTLQEQPSMHHSLRLDRRAQEEEAGTLQRGEERRPAAKNGGRNALTRQPSHRNFK